MLFVVVIETNMRIPTARYDLEGRIITVEECKQLIAKYPHRRRYILSNLSCVVCGDSITLAQGEINVTHFRHESSEYGGNHINCKLYTQGFNIGSTASALQAKLASEKDLTLSFELRLVGNKWVCFVTLPPFSSQEIAEYTNKKSSISIVCDHKTIAYLHFAEGHFAPGEIKRIGLNGFPANIFANINTAESSNTIYCKIAGFSADTQLFSTLISQDYSIEGSGRIDLSKTKYFVCKRVSGKIYVGRHYLLFRRFGLAQSFTQDEAIIKEVILPKDASFPYTAYDIVFRKRTDKTMRFCTEMKCTLLERSDAVILWPPINSIGNCKYFNNSESELFLAFEHKNETMDLYTHKTKGLFFRVKNENDRPFYVSYKEKKCKKTVPVIEENRSEEIVLSQEDNNYLFSKNVLNAKVTEKRLKLKNNQYVLSFSDRLDYKKYYKLSGKTNNDINYVLFLIRYSERYVPFSKKEYEILINGRQKDNAMIIDYLNSCLEYGRIKEKVKDYLMEEEL